MSFSPTQGLGSPRNLELELDTRTQHLRPLEESLRPSRKGATLPHQTDRIEGPGKGEDDNPPLPPSKPMTATDICTAVATIVFLPVWAIAAFFIWAFKSMASNDTKVPLEMKESLELIQSTQQPKTEDQADKLAQIRSHVFALLTADSSMNFPLKRKEPESFMDILFPWMSQPKLVEPEYEISDLQAAFRSLWNALPQSSKMFIGGIEEQGDTTAALQRFENQIIDKLFEDKNPTYPHLIDLCKKIFEITKSSSPCPMMNSVLIGLRYQREPDVFEQFLFIEPADQRDNPRDVSEAYVLTVLKRLWDSASDEFQTKVKELLQRRSDEMAKGFNEQVKMDEALNKNMAKTPYIAARLAALGLELKPIVKAEEA